jgi:hypothetical protein
VTDVPEDRADDVRLRARLLAGDDDALAEAYDRWSALVYSLAMRITADHAAAEDVTQDVFVHLWQHPDRYDPYRGALRAGCACWPAAGPSTGCAAAAPRTAATRPRRPSPRRRPRSTTASSGRPRPR